MQRLPGSFELGWQHIAQRRMYPVVDIDVLTEMLKLRSPDYKWQIGQGPRQKFEVTPGLSV